jgi:diguanylate cyclase (GGDEF)-like protein|tara:strand:+ start:1225 stop:2505 length:1281 start_codon:yes stop_codon:yes gene_type:complete
VNVLLVEDSATLRCAMTTYILNAGHHALVAESGERALQLIENSAVDLIIMDVEMPGLNGFETTRLIREWLKGFWLPIIFVTGKNDEKSYTEGIAAGGDDYLIKPISSVILKAKIHAMERIIQMRNKLSQLNNELEKLSQTDSLTQVYNRRAFDDIAQKYWLVATRRHSSISVLMLDVDHFKLYNDHYGHPAGDNCLVQVSAAMKASLLRPEDTLGRYGGEEFIVILPDTDRQGAEQLAATIRRNTEELQIEHKGSPTAAVVSISIGGATCSNTMDSSLEGLIKQADQALYKSKQAGRNRVTTEDACAHKTVLIVDDDQLSLEIVTDLLREHCNIVTADDGQECLDIARNILPDLILLDIHMLGMTGNEACRQLKGTPRTASIPVIFISSEDHNTQIKLVKAVGANDCMQKPLDADALLDKVSRYLL